MMCPQPANLSLSQGKILGYGRQVQDSNDVIALTKNIVPEAVLLSMTKFEGLLETIDILADVEMMAQLRQSAKDTHNNALIDFDEAF